MEEKINHWKNREKKRWQRYADGCPLRTNTTKKVHRNITSQGVHTISSSCKLKHLSSCNYEKCVFRHWKDYK